MQQLNVNDYYEWGKETAEIEATLSAIKKPVELSAHAWPLFLYRWRLERTLEDPCPLLPASQRAVKALITTINNLVPAEVQDIFDEIKGKEVFQPYQFSSISTAIKSFETILKNDMPEMSTFAVSQIGIMRTDDLINNAFRQIAEPLRPLLKEKSKADIVEAGKCLAFRLSTASAFHACRAIETGIDQYYEALTGKPYEASVKGGNNNWGAKTEAISKAGADEKVTEFLTHIRKQYRNPVTHPEVVVDEYEAVDLFIASLSAISMILGAVRGLNEKAQPMLAGLISVDEAPAAEAND
jgi:hypothetical protein